MRLFGKVDSAINKYDRANWLTNGPWWGFDLASGAPSLPRELSATFAITTRFSATADAAPRLSATADITKL